MTSGCDLIKKTLPTGVKPGTFQARTRLQANPAITTYRGYFLPTATQSLIRTPPGPNVDRPTFEIIYAHEFTHAYIDYVYKVTEPIWFQEGMAEYFSFLKWTSEGFIPTGENFKAVFMLQAAGLIPLKDFLAAKRSDIYGMEFTLGNYLLHVRR